MSSRSYLLFAWPDGRPCGGMDDWRGFYRTECAAKRAFQRFCCEPRPGVIPVANAQIVEFPSMHVIWRGEMLPDIAHGGKMSGLGRVVYRGITGWQKCEPQKLTKIPVEFHE